MNYEKAQDKIDFLLAVNYFTLAHSDLVAFQTILKINQFSEGVTSIASSSQQLSSITHEVMSSTSEISKHLQNLKDDSLSNISNLDSNIELGHGVKDIFYSMINNIGELNDQIKKVDNVARQVEDIANKTNLLALNAAIEAAHAGDSGKGFAVVANEVRKLAGQTKESVQEVKELSDRINDKANITKDEVYKVQNLFNQYILNSDDIALNIKKSTETIEDSVEMINKITLAMEEQTNTSEGLATTTSEFAMHSNFSETIKKENRLVNDTLIPFINSNTSEDYHSDIKELSTILISHADFLKQIIDNAGAGKPVRKHTECSFGKWYEKNYNQYKDIKDFGDMYEPHKNFHLYAENLSHSVSIESSEQLLKNSILILQKFIQLFKFFQLQNK